jgi:ATP-dependent exoDNAse (exonuclease V) beta subunit
MTADPTAQKATGEAGREGTEPARTLTDEQERAAARRQGSLLLAAGAGSGKTAVLVERFARAVLEDGIAPGRILAITFTERAAGELRERVRARLLELGRRDAARQAEAAFVSTFHGFCARLLRAHPLQAGIEPTFRILEEGFASRLQALAFADALAGLLAGALKGTPHRGGQASEREQAVDLVAAYGADPLRATVLGAHAQLRSQGQLEPHLPSPPLAPDATDEDRRALAACSLLDELLQRFGAAYSARKQARGALDFDDLELLARDLLAGHLALRSEWSGRFELLMVDEFQDSNQRQLQILAALDRDNLFTVGDELQSIYSFRHADVALFRERGEQLAGQEASLALTRNFRSRPPILAAVQRIFAERMGRRFAPLTPTRERDPAGEPGVELLLTDRRGWERSPAETSLAALPAATPWRQAEARLLAGRVAELVAREGVPPGEVVVLLRALGDLPVYEAALRAAGLPTSAAAGGFWSHQQVGDLLAWLSALANPLEEPALYSALASPLVGLSSDGLALIASFARSGKLGVWEAIEDGAAALEDLLGGEDCERLARFRELFAAQRAELALCPIAEVLGRAIAAGGYERWVLAQSWGARRLASVHKLLRLARAFEAQEGRDLRGFLDHVAHVESALGGREPDAIAGEESEAVRLMSIHAAKGLEFGIVCVVDLGREPNLRQPDLLVDAGGVRVGLRLLDLELQEARPALEYEQLCAERRSAQEEEEDRILYVACTRARERLLLSGAASFERWPAAREGAAPIAWMAPALVPGLPALLAAESRPDGPVTVELGEGLAVRCLLNAPPAADTVAVTSALDQAPERPSPPRSPVPLPPARALAQQGAAAPGGAASREPVPRALEPAPPSPPSPSTRPPGQREPEAPLADPDGTISYTSLAELERCGYRYYLERVLGMPERRTAAREAPRRGELDPRLRGTIVHALLESVDFAHPAAPSERDVAQVARRLGASITAEQRREVVALLAGALAAEPAATLARTRSARREHPFSFALGGAEPLVTGFIDLIAEQPDGTTLIVDYKSDRLAGDEDLERLVQRDYGFQRLIYALAAIEGGVSPGAHPEGRALKGTPRGHTAGGQAGEVEVAHWFLERPERWVSARFERARRDELRERLLAELAVARARGFAVAAEPHRDLCLTCPGRGGMCSWGETHTMRTRSNHIGRSYVRE